MCITLEIKKKDFEVNKFQNVQGLFNVVVFASCSREGNRYVGGLAMFWKKGVEVELYIFPLTKLMS